MRADGRLLAELRWPEVAAADRGRWVGILPVGATEAHGPHLPLGTDCLIAEAMAASGAARLASAGYQPIVLPTLPYTAAPFAAAFAGTLSIAPAVLTALVVEVARAWSALGAPALVIANAHLDPAHLGSLHAAVAQAAATGLPPLVLPDVTRKPWALRLGEEFRSGACHAGRYEGSIVLAVRPELVADEVRAGLAPNPASLSVAIREGKTSFAEAGGNQAYFGDPAAASAGEGRERIAALGEILAEAVVAAVPLAGTGSAR